MDGFAFYERADSFQKDGGEQKIHDVRRTRSHESLPRLEKTAQMSAEVRLQ